MKQKQEFSAGGIVFKNLSPETCHLKPVFLLGKHSGYHKWVLPKGLIEVGEKPEETAIRETEEEMGVVARIVQADPIHIVMYNYKAEFKLKESIKYPHFGKPSRGRQVSSIKGEGQKESNNLPSPDKGRSQVEDVAVGFVSNNPATQQSSHPTINESTRRVNKYSEEGGQGILVNKTVTFYLMEWISGDPASDHGWEMEEAGWFDFEKCLEIMGFDSEKEALKRVYKLLRR